MTIYNRMIIKTPDVFKEPLEFDEREGISHPMDSATNLHLFVIKAGSTANMRWSMTLILDFLNAGILTSDDQSTSKIEAPSNNQSWASLRFSS